jgi:hypothetical protein
LRKPCGTYVSKQIGLEARKIRATRALDTFTDPQAAVAKYNEVLGKLELTAGTQFTKLYDKAVALGHPEDVCKDFALRHASALMAPEYCSKAKYPMQAIPV